MSIGEVVNLPQVSNDDYYRLLDERRLMLNALRDLNRHLHASNTRQALKIVRHVALSLPEIGLDHG